MIGSPVDQLVTYGLRRVEIVALAEQRELQPVGPRDRPRVGLLHTRHQPQQRRLAAAVGADDPDPVAGRHVERDAAQHRARAVALLDVLEIDEVARRCRYVEADYEQADTFTARNRRRLASTRGGGS